jgi:hypothetical protein
VTFVIRNEVPVYNANAEDKINPVWFPAQQFQHIIKDGITHNPDLCLESERLSTPKVIPLTTHLLYYVSPSKVSLNYAIDHRGRCVAATRGSADQPCGPHCLCARQNL